MHHNYGVISGNHACRDCVWHIISDAELYTTCPGERVLVPTRFNVSFLPLRLCDENTRTCFSKDAENLTTYAWASAEIFPGGGNLDILLIIFKLLTMQCKWTFTKRFTLSTPQRK